MFSVVAGCSSDAAGPKASSRSARSAATVAGAKVPLTALMADLKAEADAGKKGKAKTEPSSPLASPKGDKPGTYKPEATAAALTNRILFELYSQELRAHKQKIVAADKARARQTLCADTSTGQVPQGTSCPPLAAYPAAYRAFQLTLRQHEVAFGKLIYGRVFDVVRRTEPKLLSQVCLNLVQVANQSVSSQIQKATKGGTSLADASKKAAASGTASQPQPGCLFTVSAPPNLTKAKKGDVVPVEGQSILGVAEVTSFKTATKAEFVAQPPAAATTVQKLVEGEVDRSIRRAKVSVTSGYGRWDPKKLVVMAPKSTARSTTTTKRSGSTSSTTPGTSRTTTTTAP